MRHAKKEEEEEEEEEEGQIINEIIRSKNKEKKSEISCETRVGREMPCVKCRRISRMRSMTLLQVEKWMEKDEDEFLLLVPSVRI